MPDVSLEQRVEAVENAVRELQRAIEPKKSNHDWLEAVIGSMQNDPAFNDVLAYGREFRDSQRPPETRSAVNR